MKADEFIKKLTAITPRSESLLLANRSREFVERFVAERVLLPRKKPLDIPSIRGAENLIDLFNRWDTSALTVGMIEFLDKPMATQRGMQVAVHEVDPLLIAPNGQVVVVEAYAQEHQLSEVAKSGNSFLDAIIVAAEFFGKLAVKAVGPDDLKEAQNAARDCAAAAGGKPYSRFYISLLGAEE